MTFDPIQNLPPLREVIRAYSLTAKKKLSQNFLFDLNLTARIAQNASPFDGTVIEIGPGPGGLTRALLMAGANRVIAVEKDHRAIKTLAPLNEAANGRLQLIHADALKINLQDILTENKYEDQPWQIVSNLPYNIATSLLLKWMDECRTMSRMTLMFQKEVAQRITAKPGEQAYGRLAVITQWQCETKMLFDIPPQAFVPPPKVFSTLMQITPRIAPIAPANKTELEDVTRTLFGQRRKMLRSSIRPLKLNNILEKLNLNGSERPENLTIQQFCEIAQELKKARSSKIIENPAEI